MLQPKRRKYRKEFRGKMKGVDFRGSTVEFGEFGLKSIGRGWVTSRQIEAARRTIAHQTKRGGKIWIRIFPDKPVTRKAPGSRMGSGKGDIEEYVATVKPGRILFELGGVSETVAKEAFRRTANKLPVKTIVVVRE